MNSKELAMQEEIEMQESDKVRALRHVDDLQSQLAAARQRIAELEAALEGVIPICELAEFYLPGELAEHPERVRENIRHAQEALDKKEANHA